MALESSSFDRFFVTAPTAPAAMARARSADVPKEVRIRTFDEGDALSTAAVASAPSMPGRLKSITTTSGFSSAASRTAASPFSASPQTLRSA